MPIEVKFHVEPPWYKGTKVCSNGLKMFKNLFLRNQEADDFETWNLHRVHEYNKVCSNEYPALIMTYFTSMSNLVVPYAFILEV